jgi:opacity protein-like surface antigen
MKRTILAAAVLAMGISSVATAGMYTPCTSHPVTIPCEKRGWHLLVEGLYIQPTNDDLEYFEDRDGVTPYTRYAVRPKHRFGFRVEGGYHFDSGSDLTLNYMHFDKTYHDYYLGSDQSVDVETADAHAKFDVDIVNLEFGQHYDVGDNGDLRLHFGAQYGQLDTHLMISQERYINEEGSLILQEPFEHGKYLSKFTGVGPRAGIDWYYHLPHGFDIVSRAAGSILIGEFKNEWRRTTSTQQSPGWIPFIERNTRRSLIPTAEGKAGLRWTYLGQNMAVMLEGGWHVMGIFQSIHHLGGNPNVNLLPPRPQQNISNYGHQGLYFNVSVAG